MKTHRVTIFTKSLSGMAPFAPAIVIHPELIFTAIPLESGKGPFYVPIEPSISPECYELTEISEVTANTDTAPFCYSFKPKLQK